MLNVSRNFVLCVLFCCVSSLIFDHPTIVICPYELFLRSRDKSAIFYNWSMISASVWLFSFMKYDSVFVLMLTVSDSDSCTFFKSDLYTVIILSSLFPIKKGSN